jgi:hypothetical protein
MKNGFRFGMTVPTNKTRLLKVLPCFRKQPWMATWRSGYAAVYKATCFRCLVNDHSDKTANFDPFRINGLAAASEWFGLQTLGCASAPSTRPRAFLGWSARLLVRTAPSASDSASPHTPAGAPIPSRS